MNRELTALLAGTAMAIAGCGGGSGGGIDQPVPEVAEPGEQPGDGEGGLPSAIFDCSYLASPVGQPLENQLAGGIYYGTLFDCTQGGGETEVYAMVTEDGRFRILPSDTRLGRLLTGSLLVDGDLFQGSGQEFEGAGTPDLPDLTADIEVDGYVASRDRLDGRWFTPDFGDYGYFTLQSRWGLYYFLYDPPEGDPLPQAPALDWLAGNYEDADNRFGAQVSWTVTESGAIEGGDTTGCEYAGQIAVIEPEYNLYDVAVTIANCTLAGDYQGLLFRDYGPFGDPFLNVSIDDGQQRAIGLSLGDFSGWE